MALRIEIPTGIAPPNRRSARFARDAPPLAQAVYRSRSPAPSGLSRADAALVRVEPWRAGNLSERPAGIGAPHCRNVALKSSPVAHALTCRGFRPLAGTDQALRREHDLVRVIPNRAKMALVRSLNASGQIPVVRYLAGISVSRKNSPGCKSTYRRFRQES